MAVAVAVAMAVAMVKIGQTHQRKAQAGKSCWLFLGPPLDLGHHLKVSPVPRKGLPSSVYPTWKCPSRATQRCVS